MKKFLCVLAAVLPLTMLVSLAACGSTGSPAATGESGAADATAASDFKIGAIMLGDETEGYSAAHITGIKTAAEELGLSEDQIVWKYKIPEGAECLDAAEDLVAQGCDCGVLACTELSVFADKHHLPPFYTDAMAVLAERAVQACGKPLRTIFIK